MNETIKRCVEQLREADRSMRETQTEIEQHQASIDRLAPEFNKKVAEKARLFRLLMNELELIYPEASQVIKLVE